MINNSNLILTEPVSQPKLLNGLTNIDSASDETKKKLAKDFESIFIYKLLEEMRKTIGEWGFDEDAAANQVNGIFSLLLAEDIAKNGGMGFWKNIYEFLADSQKQTNTLDNKI